MLIIIIWFGLGPRVTLFLSAFIWNESSLWWISFCLVFEEFSNQSLTFDILLLTRLIYFQIFIHLISLIYESRSVFVSPKGSDWKNWRSETYLPSLSAFYSEPFSRKNPPIRDRNLNFRMIWAFCHSPTIIIDSRPVPHIYIFMT